MKPIFINYSLEDLFSRVNQFEIWWDILEEKLQEFELIRNPFREDTRPGCWLSEYNNNVYLIDFADKHVSLLNALQLKYNLHYYEVMQYVNTKYNVGYPDNPVSPLTKRQVKLRTNKETGPFKAHISFERRYWEPRDEAFWTPYGISSEQLETYGVFPVYMYRKNNKYDKVIKHTYPVDLCYAYTFDNGNIKLYRPFGNRNKWSTNTDKHDVWGPLFPLSKTAFVTSSLKDLLVLENVLGKDIYAGQNEHVIFDNDWIESMNNLYDNVYLLYDNDRSGKKGAEKIASLSGWIPIYIDGRSGCKDPAEYYVKYGEKKLFDHINNKL